MTYVMSTVRYEIRYAHMGDIRMYLAQICTGRRLVQCRGRFQYNNVLCSSTRRTQRYAAQDPHARGAISRTHVAYASRPGGVSGEAPRGSITSEGASYTTQKRAQTA
jgi:hypothetical protein